MVLRLFRGSREFPLLRPRTPPHAHTSSLQPSPRQRTASSATGQSPYSLPSVSAPSSSQSLQKTAIQDILIFQGSLTAPPSPSRSVSGWALHLLSSRALSPRWRPTDKSNYTGIGAQVVQRTLRSDFTIYKKGNLRYRDIHYHAIYVVFHVCFYQIF